MGAQESTNHVPVLLEAKEQSTGIRAKRGYENVRTFRILTSLSTNTIPVTNLRIGLVAVEAAGSLKFNKFNCTTLRLPSSVHYRERIKCI
jgi:hypothetical protein